MPLYVLAAFAIVTGALMIRIEDRELEARFGEPYRAYRVARFRRLSPGRGLNSSHLDTMSFR